MAADWYKAPYRRYLRWRRDRAWRANGRLDPQLKERFVQGERFSDEEIAQKYDTLWERFEDDCVAGSDLDQVLAHLRDDVKTCLDVGCGAGRVAVKIATTGRSVTGMDISAEALNCAERTSAEAGVQIAWVKGSLEGLPFPDNAFDAVTCLHTLEHVQDLQRATDELIRVAAKQVVVIVPREDGMNTFSTDYHFQFFPDPRALEDAIPLPDHECFLARVPNDQWQGEYVFFSGRTDRAG